MAKPLNINPFDRSFRKALEENPPTNQSLPNHSSDCVKPAKDMIDAMTRSHSFSFFPKESATNSVPVNGCGELSTSTIVCKNEHTLPQINNPLMSLEYDHPTCPQSNTIVAEPSKSLQRLPSNLSLLRCESVEEFLRINNLTLGSSSSANLIHDFAHSFVGLEDSTAPNTPGLPPDAEGISQSLISPLAINEDSLPITDPNTSRVPSESNGTFLPSSLDENRFSTLVRLLSTICSDLNTHLRNLPTLPVERNSDLPTISSVSSLLQTVPHHPTCSTHISVTLDDINAACPPSSRKSVPLSDSHSTDSQTFQQQILPHQKLIDVTSRKRPYCDKPYSCSENLDRDNLIARIRQRCGRAENCKPAENGSVTEREGENDSQRLDSVSISCSDSSAMSFLERNRLAARKARRKKKMYTQELERDHATLKKAYNKLKNRCEALKKENVNLRLVMSQLLQEKVEMCRDVVTPIELNDSTHQLSSNRSTAANYLLQSLPASHSHGRPPTVNSNASLLLVNTPSSEQLEHLNHREINGVAHTVNSNNNFPRYIIIPQQVDKSIPPSNNFNSTIGSAASLCILSSTVETESQLIGLRPH